MVAIEPPRNGMTLGELYTEPNLTKLIILPHSVDGNSIDAIMTECGRDASMHDISFDRTFKLDAEAALIGSEAAALKSQGATSYSVAFRGPKHFTLSLHSLADKILPTFDELTQQLIVGETYYIASLLRVEGMEYTFKDNSGAAVDLGHTLHEVALKLDAEVSTKKHSTLTFDSPRFIGFSMNKLIVTKVGEGEETQLWADIEGKTVRVVKRAQPEITVAAAPPAPAEAAAMEPVAEVRPVGEAGRSPDPDSAAMSQTATVAVRNFVIEAQEVPHEELERSQRGLTAQ